MVIWIVLVGAEAVGASGFGIFRAVVDVEEVTGGDAEFFDSSVVDLGLGFFHFYGVAIDSVFEVIEDGVGAQDVVHVQAASIGEDVEGEFFGESVDGLNHGVIEGEDFFPGGDEFLAGAGELAAFDGSGDEGVVVDIAAFEGEFDFLEGGEEIEV